MDDEKRFLEDYDIERFERPSVAVDVVAFSMGSSEAESYRKLPDRALQVLLVKRAEHPFKDSWALPGTFMLPGDEATARARACLHDKTGVDHAYLEQLYTWSDPKRDPRGWILSCSYLAMLDRSIDDERESPAGAKWFTVKLELIHEETDHLQDGRVTTEVYRLTLHAEDEDELTAFIDHRVTVSPTRREEEFIACGDGDLAFDHAKIIVYAMLRLRNKIEYTDLALNLMPETFTLTALQQTYEAILGHTLIKAAFRRTTAELVEETDEYTSSAGHRPSRLYRRNWFLTS